MADKQQVVLEQADLGKAIRRMAHEILEKCADPTELVLIGIRSRGVYLARRLARTIEEFGKSSPPVTAIDVSAFRDDRAVTQENVSGGVFETEPVVEDKTIVLIDDVIYRGRTIRAAMEAVERLGQSKRILVAALIDRGSRELPIRADIVGKNFDVAEGQRVNVRLVDADGIDQVFLVDWRGRSTG
jgi:pyrimidine operon attenuation protein / uracil phosphoribosyltransferase